MKYKLALFDFDGTLADSALWFLKALNTISSEFGFKPIPDSDHERVRGFDTAQFLKHLEIPFWKVPKMALRLRQMAASSCSEMRLFPSTVELLEQLHTSGIGLGIVSSNSAETIRTVLGPHVAGRILYYSCGASVLGKAAHLRRVLRRARIQPAEAIYIGDEIRDAAAAREVGMAFGAVGWGYATPAALLAQQPTHFFASSADLLASLLSGKGACPVPAQT